MSLFKPPSATPISSAGGGGGGTSIGNSSSSVSIINNPTTGGNNVQISTSGVVAVAVDTSQNVLIGNSSAALTKRLTVAAPLGQCIQLINETTNKTASFVVNADGGLGIATSGSNIQLGSNNLFVSPSSLYIGSTAITSSGVQLNYTNVTPGIATELKAMVVDANRSIVNINSLTAATLTATSLYGTIRTAAQPYITSLNSVNITSLSLNGTLVQATADEINYLKSTPGSARLSKAMILDYNKSITGITSLSADSLSGTIQTASQPNITSIGVLTSLNSSGDVIIGSIDTASSSVRLVIKETNGQMIRLMRSATIGCDLTISALGDLEINPTRDIRIVTGKSIRMSGALTGVTDLVASTLTGSIQTANQPLITSVGTLSSLTVTNGISAASVVATNLTGTIQTAAQPNITSIGTLSSLAVTNGITADSLTATNVSGTIQTALQPNITSVGTLSLLAVTGAITSSSVTATNLTGTIQTAAQPNITSIGALSSLIVANGITATGVTASTLTGTIQTAAQPNITSIGTLANLSVTNALTASSVSASTLTGTLQTGAQPNITSIGTISSLAVTNGITASSLSASTLIGTIQTSYQPNITSIGVLNNLSLLGPIGIGVLSPSCAIDINTSDLSFNPTIKLNNGTINATIDLGINGLVLNTNGQYVTLGTGVGLRFSGGGLVGLTSITANELTGTLQTAAQPNITSVGKLTNLDTDYIGLGITHDSRYRINLFDSTGKMLSMSDGTQSMLLSVVNGDYTIDASNNRLALGSNVNLVLNGGTIIGLDTLTATNIAGTIQTAAQPNITSVGTLSSLSVSGAINGGSVNISGGAHVGGDLTIDGALILSTPLSYNNFSSSTAVFNSDVAATSSTNGGTLTVTGGAAFSKNVIIGTSLTIGSTVLTSESFSALAGATPGIVTAGVFLSSDSNKDLTGFRNLTSTNLYGLIKTCYQPCITTVGNLTNLNVNGYVGVGTAAPAKQIEINSTTGDCLRLTYDKANNGGYLDVRVDAGGNSTLATSGTSITMSQKLVTPQIILGGSNCSTMPLEVGFVPFVMTQAYAFNTNVNAHGLVSAGSTTSYNYSIRAHGRILCTQSVDVMSDRRTKKNIVDLSDEFCSSFISKTTPVSFNWIDGDNNKSFGYIAQDLVRAGFSDLVNLTRDDSIQEEIDEDGFISPEGVKFTVTYQHIIPILAKNQKRLMQENAELKEKLDAILGMLQNQ